MSTKKSKKLSSKWSVKKPLYIDNKDKRYKKYVKQLKEDGFSNTETWNLDCVFSEFVLPRLKRYRDISPCYPCGFKTIKQWHKVVDKMIFAFEWVLKRDELVMDFKQIEKGTKKYTEGIELFAKYFHHLWW